MKAAVSKARNEERESAKAALEARMQSFRDGGATEAEVVRAGRQLLRDRGASEKEIEECKVDMDRVVASDRWWEEEEVIDVNMDTSETIHDVNDDDDDANRGTPTTTELALPRTQKYMADRKRARASREVSVAGSDEA